MVNGKWLFIRVLLMTLGLLTLTCPSWGQSALNLNPPNLKDNDGKPVKLSEGYLFALKSSLSTARTLSAARRLNRAVAGTLTVEQIDGTAFPVIKAQVSVTDAAGKVVEGLTADKFSVFEDTKPVKDFTLSTVKGTGVDMVFCLDTTGSMSGEIEAVKNGVQRLVDDLVSAGLDVRLAGISFGDEVPYRDLIDFTTDVANFKAWVSAQTATGGADLPENPLDALIAAANLKWRDGVQRIVILTVDSPPHVKGDGGDSLTERVVGDAVAALAAAGVIVYYWLGPGSDFDPADPNGLQAIYDVLGRWLGLEPNFSKVLDIIGSLLRTKYFITFTTLNPNRDGTERGVIIRVSLPAEAVQGQGSYVAPREREDNAKIVVSVLDASTNRAISNAAVSLSGPLPGRGIVARGVTDDSGRITFDKLPAGKSFTVTAQADGFLPASAEAIATTDATATMLKLQRIGDVFEELNQLIGQLQPSYPTSMEEAARVVQDLKRVVDSTDASDADRAKALEAAERLRLSLQFALVAQDDANLMADAAANGPGALLGLFLELIKNYKIVQELIGKLPNSFDVLGVPIDLRPFKEWVRTETIAQLGKVYDYLMNQIAAILPHSLFGADMRTRFWRAVKELEKEILEATAIAKVEELITNFIHDFFRDTLLMNLYRAQSKPSLDEGVNFARNRAFRIGKLDDARSRVLARRKQMTDETAATDQRVRDLHDASKALDLISTLAGIGSAISRQQAGEQSRPSTPSAENSRLLAIGFPPAAGVAAALQFVSFASAVTARGLNLVGSSLAAFRLFQIPGDLKEGINLSFDQPGMSVSKTTEGSAPSGRLVPTSAVASIQNYSQLLEKIKARIGARDPNGLIDLLNNSLPPTSARLDSEVDTALAGIVVAASRALERNIAGFDEVFQQANRLVILGKSRRLVMHVKLLQFLFDSENPDVVSSVVPTIDAVQQIYTQVDLLLSRASNMIQVNNVTVPPIVTVKSISVEAIPDEPNVMEVKARVQNLSTESANEVAVTLELLGISDLRLDSPATQLLGTIGAGEEVEAVWKLRSIVSRGLTSETRVTGISLEITSANATSVPATNFFLNRTLQRGTTPVPPGLTMIAFPVVPSRSLASQFPSGAKWAWWDPSESKYRIGPPGEPPVGIGTGLWVKSPQAFNLDVVGIAPSGDAPIRLTKGWNLIGFPYADAGIWKLDAIKVRKNGEDKTLEEAQAEHWIEDYAWGWKQDENDPNKGSYFLVYDTGILPNVASQLEPWKGYWVYAHQDCELILPPPSQSKGRGTRDAGRMAKGNGWAMKLVAKVGDESGEAILGVSQGSRGLAIGLPPEPPEGSSNVQVLVLNNGAPLAVDVRNNAARQQVWDVVVKFGTRDGRRGTRQKEVTLTWDGVGYAPKDVSLTLVDLATGTRRYMRTQTEYRFVPNEGENERRFKVIADLGNERPLRIVGLKAIPMRGQGVVIEFALTKPAQVQAEVLTLTGRKVTVVEAQTPRSSGTHRIVWQGVNKEKMKVSSSVYLIRLIATDEEGRQVQASLPVRLR